MGIGSTKQDHRHGAIHTNINIMFFSARRLVFSAAPPSVEGIQVVQLIKTAAVLH